MTSIQQAQKISDSVSRRALLTGGLAGGFLLAFHLPLRAAVNEPSQPPDVTDGKFAPNAFIRIDTAGKTTLVMPQVEMGQGVYTSIAMILAEELDADFSQVELQHAPPNEKLYGNPVFGMQATGNSNSIRAFWKPLRSAGASARAMLVQAAAAQWQVDAGELHDGERRGDPRRQRPQARLWRVGTAASSRRRPRMCRSRIPKDFVLIGKPLKRLDTPDKVNGKAIYGIDAMLPGMKFATLAQSPVFGGKVGNVDDSDAKKIPGVRQIVVLDDLVAVVGDHMWAAKKGLEALKIDWNEGPNAKSIPRRSGTICARPAKRTAWSPRSVGDIAKGLATGEKFEASYELPFLAHATMEPMNATVHSSLTPANSGPAPRSWRGCSRKRPKRPGFRSRK